MKIFFLPLLLVNGLVMYLMLLLYGKDYPINFGWMTVFSLNALLYSLVHIKWSMIITEGTDGLKVYAWHSLAGAIISLGLNIFLIKEFGIIGAAFAAIVTYVYFLTTAGFYLKKERHHTLSA